MPSWWIAACILVLGLAVGSFMTVVATRVPLREGIVKGRSHCDHCGYQLTWYDNVPLLSWLALRGRCRGCRARVSVMYPLMEAAVAGLWLTIWLAHGLSWTTAALAVFAAVSVALVVIDITHHRLPHVVVLPTAVVVGVLALAAWLAGEQGPWWRAFAGLAILGGFYGLLWFIYPKGMGFGDVTTGALAGFVLGLLGWSHLMVGALAGPLLGGVIAAVGMALGRTRWGKAIPYGPALLAGAWVGILAGEPLASGYLSLFGV